MIDPEALLGASDLENAQAEIRKLRAELDAMNTAIGFETTCLGCAATLNGAYEQTVRAETAEAELERAQPVLDAARAWATAWPNADGLPASQLLDALRDLERCARCGGLDGTHTIRDCAGQTRKPSALHIGRSWVGHEIEDGCPCPQAPCGLVDTDTIDSNCPEHALFAAKSVRQGHRADECAGHTRKPSQIECPHCPGMARLELDGVYRCLHCMTGTVPDAAAGHTKAVVEELENEIRTLESWVRTHRQRRHHLLREIDAVTEEWPQEARDVADAVRDILNRPGCRACPPGCVSCTVDGDCECYDHQDAAEGLSSTDTTEVERGQ